MGRSPRHGTRGGRGGGGRNNSNNTRNAYQETRDEYTVDKAKPTLAGAENVVFTLAEGAMDSKGDSVFLNKLKILSMCLSNHSAFRKGGGVEVSQALKTLKPPTFTRPVKPKLTDFQGDTAADDHEFALKEYESTCDELIETRKQFQVENKVLYTILFQHSTTAFWNQLEGSPDFKKIDDERDGIRLAKLMQTTYVTGGSEQNQDDVFENAADMNVRVLTHRQQPNQSNENFVNQSTAMVEALESQGEYRFGYMREKVQELIQKKLVELGLPSTPSDVKNVSVTRPDVADDAYAEVQEQFHVQVLLRLIDQNRYGDFIATTRRSKLTSKVEWPKTRAALIVLLDKWEKELRLEQQSKRQQQRQQQQQQQQRAAAAAAAAANNGTTPSKIEGGGGDEEKGPSFMQQQGNKRTNSKGESKCHICGAEDHWKNECPRNKSNDDEGVSGMQQHVADSDSDGELWVEEGANFGQTMESEQNVEEAKVYFDSCTAQSTVDAAELTDVHNPDRILKVLCNAGQMEMNQVGKLGDLDAWGRGDGQGIANLISIPKLEIYLQQQGGELKYSSNGEWILTLRGRTAVLRRDATGPCAGMPYMYLAEARAFFAPSDPQLEAVDIPHASDEQGWKLVLPPKKSRSGKQPRSILKPSKKSILKPPKKHQKQKPSAVVSAEANDDATTHPALVVSWVRPKVTGKVKARIVTRGDLHMQQSIRGNMEGFSKRQILRAHEARLLQGCIANLSEREFNDLHAPTYAAVLLGLNQRE